MTSATTTGAISMQAIDLAAFEDFLVAEAALLDGQAFEDWLALFTDDGRYWVPAIWNQASPLDSVSIHYEDKALLQVRIMRLRHPQTENMRPAPRTLHNISNVRIERVDDEAGECVVASNLLMVEYRLDAQRLVAGGCHHRLRWTEKGWRIAEKRVDLLDCDSENGFVRFTIPF